MGESEPVAELLYLSRRRGIGELDLFPHHALSAAGGAAPQLSSAA